MLTGNLIVGAFVSVEVTAGITDAPTRSRY
jgi:hypothetical protein